jgi:hypothetical protein
VTEATDVNAPGGKGNYPGTQCWQGYRLARLLAGNAIGWQNYWLASLLRFAAASAVSQAVFAIA